MSNFLNLWDALQTTDPAFTKNFSKGGGFKGTAINACYVMKKLTETFGPCGVGWRFVLDHQEFVNGHVDNATGVMSIVHVVLGHLDYKHNKEWVSTGPQFGQTTFVGTNKHGGFTDEEAPKKSITDCLSKCAVSIGLSADIHLGLWDDNKYVNDGTAGPPAAARRAAPQRPAPAAPPESPAQRIKSPVWADIERTADPAALHTVYQKASRTAALTGDRATWEEVLAAVATAWRRINLPDDPASQQLLADLQAERVKLDGGTPNETTQQETSPPVRKPRARKKPVPA